MSTASRHKLINRKAVVPLSTEHRRNSEEYRRSDLTFVNRQTWKDLPADGGGESCGGNGCDGSSEDDEDEDDDEDIVGGGVVLLSVPRCS